MTTGQAPIKVKTGNALDTEETTSNVATNKAALAALKAANVDGKDIYPQSISTQRLNLSEWLSVGGGVTLTEGCVQAEHLVQTEAVITQSLQVGENIITEDAISVPNLSSINANLGTITAGSVSIGSGGVTIGSATAGIGIMGNQIFCKTGGVTTVLIDGATGVISATKFELTADANSKITLNSGTHIFSDSIQVGTSTLGGMKSATATAQSTANTANSTANSAYTLADSAIKPGGGVSVDGSKYITTIDMTSGIVIRTGNSNPRTQITSNGVAVYNSSGSVVAQMDHVNGFSVVNYQNTPSALERLSLNYNNGSSTAENGRLYGYNSDTYIYANAGLLYLYGYGSVGIWSEYQNIYLGTSAYPTLKCVYGDLQMQSGYAVEFGSSGPTITSGSGTPSSSEPDGSIYMSTGGSLWVRYSGAWKRVWHDGNQSGTVAHTH